MSDRNDAPVDYEVVFPDTPHEPGETTAADAEAISAPCSADEVMDTIDPHGVVRAKQSVDVAALRATAEAATPGPWVLGHELVTDLAGSAIAATTEFVEGYLDDWRGENNAKFIAAANPSAVLAILDERDDDEAHIAQLEAMLDTENQGRIQAEAARDRAIRALRDLRNEFITCTKDRDRFWCTCTTGYRAWRSIGEIVHALGCPVPDAEAVLREAEGAS